MDVLKLSLAMALGVSACVPAFDDRGSHVTATRVLAIRAEPAEAAPGETVTYRALFAGPNGIVATVAGDWAHCIDRKPLTDLAPISTRCMQPTADWLLPLRGTDTASGELPTDGCRLFGPNPPEPLPGQPPGRPVDPDSTGGYQQPVRVRFASGATDGYAAYGIRITCGLAGATREQTADFTERYHRNENPAIEGIEATAEGALSGDALADGGEVTVAPGVRMRFEVRWPACARDDACGDSVCGASESRRICPSDCETPRGCAGAETYVLYDRIAQHVTTAREHLRVAWFATGGTFEQERTDSTGDANETENVWIAPSASSTVTVWLVLRDDRGGTSWQHAIVHVGG